HRYLHSFPTRRSSDLLPEAEEKLKETLRLDSGFAQGHTQLASVYALMRRYDEALAELKIVETEHAADNTNGTPWPGMVGYVYALDRKSTRLNSSHSQI